MFWKRPQIKTAAKGVTGLVGVAALASALLIGPWENGAGNKPILIPYLDGGGVATACTGATGPDITAAYYSRRIFTESECKKIDTANLMTHTIETYSRITFRPIPDLTGAAFVSFHYNVGDMRFASSTLLKKANAGDLRGACAELSRWTRIGGIVSRGLEKRRTLGDAQRLSERTVCMIGLDPSYKTPLFDKLIMKVVQ